ncbi:MAG TPA: saccharopine dehydrogenase NADP-binding domain-containing protein [Candidatus Binatia bacterium]|nr:saccharopine dehydrogenase NADP-binding domain-containing protein [Candidatus Binatia bacterium]
MKVLGHLSMESTGILYLSNDGVKQVLDLGAAIEITEQALRDHHDGRVIWSTPEDLAIKPATGWQSWVTGCALETQPVAGFRVRSIKAAGGSRDLSRPARGPRRILILTDREGGEILGIMDEDWCHAVRTAAAAAVACRLLARSGSSTMAMLGAGDTARAAVPVMAKAFNLKEVRVTSRTPESRQKYAREVAREYGLTIRPVDSTEEALKGADIVLSATTTSSPFVEDHWLGEGVTVYSIGKNQEMASSFYKKADKFVFDSWQHCKNKSDMQRMLKENYLSEKDIYAELPELLAGKKPGRQSDRERIFIRAIGLVNQDIALADWIYRRAIERGIGTRLPY